MNEIQAYINSIQAVFPDFVIEKVQAHHGEGQFNDILVINDAVIFRFPRYTASVNRLAAEVRLLKMIGGSLPLAIPNPVYVNLQTVPAIKAFMGYPLLSGKPLWRDQLRKVPDNQVLQRIVNQIADFLYTLHHFPVHDFPGEYPLQDDLQVWTTLYAEIQQHLFPLMRSTARAQVIDHFEKYLHQPQLQKFVISLRHGDFGPSNILHNPENYTVTGIIDFDSAGLGDPAVDLAAISCYGETFFERFCSVYPVDKIVLERARFYRGTYALQEALHGFKNNDQQAFDDGMAEYI